jgi:LEA14-like dessication related protein
MKWYIFPIAVLIGLSSCSDVKEPEFRKVSDFKVREMGIQETTIGFHVTYFNPNNFGVTVKETQADVWLDSIYLGKFYQDTAVNVSKNADFSIPLTGKISLQTALKMNFQDLDTREILLKAEGSTRVGKAGIFIQKPIRYEGKHKLEEIRF